MLLIASGLLGKLTSCKPTARKLTLLLLVCRGVSRTGIRGVPNARYMSIH